LSDSRYLIHKVCKYSGGKFRGFRVIEEPNKELKKAQRLFIKELEKLITFPQYINGVSRTSTITNSRPHVHKPILYKIDLKDFFQTVTVEHIQVSLPEALGSDWQALCMMDDRLPTGAPSSPILANIAFLNTDKKIIELLRNTDISYTRYMDDLSFSSSSLSVLTPDLVDNIINTIQLDKWTINKKKSGLSLSFKRQEVTGIVVNSKINYPRDRKLLLRSKLDHLARISNVISAELAGELAYVSSIDKSLSANFINYFDKRVKKYAICTSN
jgi:RNA-directed DNA polymerase